MANSRQQPEQQPGQETHQGPGYEFSEPYSGEPPIGMMTAFSEASSTKTSSTSSSSSSGRTSFFAAFFSRSTTVSYFDAAPYSGDLSTGQLEDMHREREQAQQARRQQQPK